MEKHVYFVRHGESEENVTRVYLADAAQLTEQGMSQATIVADRIQAIGVEAIITSPLLRTRNTAAAIAARMGLVAEENELLREWAEPSELVGMHVDDPIRKEIRETIRGAVDDHDYRHSDEETFSELVARAKEALLMLEARQEERVCVVTHGGFLRIMLGVMTFGDAFTKKEFMSLFWHFHASNTGITYAYYNSDKLGWKLITWNDQAHLG